jgi:PIN domain nuclease of toxin-antitoxin system
MAMSKKDYIKLATLGSARAEVTSELKKAKSLGGLTLGDRDHQLIEEVLAKVNAVYAARIMWILATDNERFDSYRFSVAWGQASFKEVPVDK